MGDPGPMGSGAPNASIESLFANLRRQNSNPPPSTPPALASMYAQYGTPQQQYGTPQQQQYQQNQVRHSFTSSTNQASDGPSNLSYPQPSAYPQQMTPTVHGTLPPNGGLVRHSSANTGPDVHSPATHSPAPSATPSNADRASSLLNLLRFSQPKQDPAPAVTPDISEVTPYPGHGHGQLPSNGGPAGPAHQGHGSAGGSISASDLIASFMAKNATPGLGSASIAPASIANPTVQSQRPESTSAPSAQTQQFLLNLLNRPKPSQGEEASASKTLERKPTTEAVVPVTLLNSLTKGLAEASLQDTTTAARSDARQASPTPAAKQHTPTRVFGDSKENDPAPFEAPQPLQKGSQSLFTYVNPFDQLAASSPRNRTPKPQKPQAAAEAKSVPRFEILQRAATSATTSTSDSHKRKNKAPSPGPEQAPVRRKLTSGPDDVPSSASSPAPAPLPDGRSQIEALIGIGASNQNHSETVADALSEIGEEVDQQVEKALAKAEGEAEALARSESRAVEADVSSDLRDAATVIRHELNKQENRGALEETLPQPIADAVRAVIEDTAQSNLHDSWESADADDSSFKDGDEPAVKVYTFPLKPFASLHLKANKDIRTFRDDAIMDIARLKKDFDQLDRTLVTASDKFIVYGMSKHGGIRLIRQDDGRDKQVFSNTNDRVFQVALSTAPAGMLSSGTEAVLGTGVGGSVYWMAVAKANESIWEDQNIQSYAFIFPPIASQDESSSGGQLKTRAKTSSRNPDFFAVGRGKAIYLIWPSVASSARYLTKKKERVVVDAEKYLQERCLKIATGKAGKDFTFSEDDSTIASLDKVGRLRIWDVRDLIESSNGIVQEGAHKIAPIEVKTPMITFMTTVANEKAWPSSVLFVDKSKPYQRAIAQRYILVGLNQNHTLQLWDLALGKAVQELHFPHDHESDAICSVVYHAYTGMIVVGHPTRNAIYFVHLSAPRYNLSPQSQARYIERLAEKDPSLPRPEATAIMTGMREYNLGNKGQLRSLDILSHPNTVDNKNDAPLFELYVMHSKGVTSLTIKRNDLGLDVDGRMFEPVDAEAKGLVVMEELKEAQPVSRTASPPSTNGDKGPTTPAREVSKKAAASSKSQAHTPDRTASPAKNASKPDTSRSLSTGTAEAATTAAEKPLKKKKKAAADAAARASDDTATMAAAATSSSAQPSKSSKSTAEGLEPAPSSKKALQPPSGPSENTSVNVGVSGDFLNKEIQKIEKTVSAEFSKVIKKELDALYRQFDEDKRIQAASGDARQDAVLRLVSSTLSDNVEKSLARMIGQSMQQSVLPSIADVTASTLHRSLGETLREHLHRAVPRELKTALPDSLGRALQTPEVLRAISELVSDKVARHVHRDVSALLEGTVAPAFKSLTMEIAPIITNEVERRCAEVVQRADAHRENDSLKIVELHDLVRGLTHTVSRMADAQTDFQQEILKLQRQLSVAQAAPHSQGTQGQAESSRASSRQQSVHTPNPALKTPEQEERDAITELMREERYEEATVKWLQSPKQNELFDRLFVRIGPAYTQSLSPLVLLSVAATVSASLDTNIGERLRWLEMCFARLDPRDRDVKEVLPKVMDVLIQRLERLYMRINESNPQDPVRARIAPLTRLARDLMAPVA